MILVYDNFIQDKTAKGKYFKVIYMYAYHIRNQQLHSVISKHTIYVTKLLVRFILCHNIYMLVKKDSNGYNHLR